MPLFFQKQPRKLASVLEFFSFFNPNNSHLSSFNFILLHTEEWPTPYIMKFEVRKDIFGGN